MHGPIVEYGDWYCESNAALLESSHGRLSTGTGLRGEHAASACHVLPYSQRTHLPLRLVPKLFYQCDQGQADPVVAVAREQSSVHLQLLMHETQPPSHFSVSTVTRYGNHASSAATCGVQLPGAPVARRSPLLC